MGCDKTFSLLDGFVALCDPGAKAVVRVEGGVLHPQWIEETFLEKDVEGLAAYDFGDAARHGDPEAVFIVRAWLEGEWSFDQGEGVALQRLRAVIGLAGRESEA